VFVVIGVLVMLACIGTALVVWAMHPKRGRHEDNQFFAFGDEEDIKVEGRREGSTLRT
jgi:nitrogen fixation-related uncharacterized protein